VVKVLLGQMNAANLEVITLYYGQPVSSETAEALGEDLRRLYANQEIEVIDGKQPFYHYIISAE
jgi:dihydroxyacetone kinase-like predicted kinase